ncbi:hypothetical protein CspeluHIS016_0204060 [Cutaneotrichosporon spelunceum]|uniref:Restriction endonuclease type IV Mrr domain-containing protein n=1 Tax=Cutaneotrichosporon spelunceum TaxID=1672016 RepID=A0AAD3TR72_9TREE|nr:hypothetical protein CspeluHIS016_0204060 [Cutaneotrichosporon spelunceum]
MASTRAIGLAFETYTQRFLNNDLRMSLAHVGGRGDGGVDLRGFWWVPRRPRRRASGAGQSDAGKSDAGKDVERQGEREEQEQGWKPPRPPGLKRDGTPGARIRPFRVVVQCKAERRTLGPRVVREFEGTLGHLAAQDSRVPLLGVLASQSGFSFASMEHAVRARACLSSSCILRPGADPNGGPTVPVTGAWWNTSLGAMLSDAGIELRREIVGGGTRVGVLTAGVRMGRYGPPATPEP